MTKIMLIKPAYETDAVWDTIRTSHPLGLWWIGSALKEEGHEVRLLDETVRNNGFDKKIIFSRKVIGGEIVGTPLDTSYEEFQKQKMKDFNLMSSKDFVDKYSAFRGDYVQRNMVRTGNLVEETLEEVGKINPDYVGIPIFASCNYPSAMALASSLKKEFPLVKIVMGGQHVTAQPLEILSHNFVDYVITGDAVTKFKELVSRRSLMRKFDGGTSNIDDFPLLDMDLMKENVYPIKPTHTPDTNGRKSIDYMFSKGCFRDCEFCVAGRKENAVSTIKLDKIDEQLQRFRDSGIEEIIVQDDAFLYKPNTGLKNYLSLMKNHGLYWQDNGGIEFEGLTQDVINLFLEYQKGEGKINALYVPLNPRSGHQNESALRDMRNRFSRNFSHINILRDSGIFLYTSEIIGYPGKPIELMEEDITLHEELVKQGYVSKSMTFVTSTLPGTELYDKYKQYIVRPNDWAAYSNFVPQSTTPEVSNIREIERITVERNQRMNKIQQSYSWGSTFSNC